MNIFQIAAWLAATGLAACVGVSSYVVANEVKAPAVAHAAGFPPTGTAEANVAAMMYAVRIARDPHAAVAAPEAEMARESFRVEPLSSTALSLIVSAMPAGTPRNKLLALSGDITRRNGLLNEEQIKLAAARGDDEAFFRWLSRSVLTNNALRTGYVGAMAVATAKPGAVASLTPVVGPAPRWADFYWQQVIQHSASLANAAKLRVAIANAPWTQTEIKPTDQGLMLALVNGAQFDAAHDLYTGLGMAPPSRGENLLVNTGFTRQPLLAPFDWQLAVSGSLGATIDEGQKRLVVSAIGGARGYAARQLVRLAPGSYRFAWSLDSSAPIAPSALSARIYCAERGVKSVAPLPIQLVAGNKFASIDIADGACRWHWLSINVALADDAAGVDIYFRNISLTPERAAVGASRGRAAPL